MKMHRTVLVTSISPLSASPGVVDRVDALLRC